MVNRGTETDYRSLRDHLDRLRIPLFPMVGNHDNRTVFRKFLPLPEDAMETLVQYPLPMSGVTAFALDTLKVGADAGEFCAARSDWLMVRLAEAPAGPILLFMHHPPMALGLPMQDTDNLIGGSEFLDRIRATGRQVYLCIGHVHRPITGIASGIPFATMRSVLYQAPPPQPSWDWASFAPAEEDPDIGIVTIDGQDITIQYQRVCDFSLGT